MKQLPAMAVGKNLCPAIMPKKRTLNFNRK